MAKQGEPVQSTSRKRHLNTPVLIFSICMLLTGVAWDHYLNSEIILSRVAISNLILLAGIFFSLSCALFVRSLEKRRDELEDEVEKKVQELLRKDEEHKTDNVASVAICWMSQMVFSEQKLDGLLDSAMDLIKKVLKADEGSLMLLNRQNELYIAKSSGIPKDVAQKVRLKIGERVAGRVLQRKREYLLIGNVKEHPDFPGAEGNPDIGSSMVCPLICNGQTLGVLSLNRKAGKEVFTDHDLRHTLTFSYQLAQAIWNERIIQSLKTKDTELEEAYRKLKTADSQ